MPDPTPTDCLSILKLIIYADTPDKFDEAECIRIREHLKVCPDCRWIVEAAIDLTSESDTDPV